MKKKFLIFSFGPPCGFYVSEKWNISTTGIDIKNPISKRESVRTLGQPQKSFVKITGKVYEIIQ